MKLVTLLIAALAVPLILGCGIPVAQPVSESAPTSAPVPTQAATATIAPSDASATSTPQPPAASSRGRPRQYEAPPAMTIDADASYTATIRTNLGNIEVKLFAAETPITVNNFVFLANQGFYDGVLFHRVIPGFMIQGGDPTGTGAGGPGYRFKDEFVSSLVFDRQGLLAMANAGPGTNGSQFFITVAPTPNLTGKHTIFGEVIAGQEVAVAASTVATGQGDRPVESVIIETVKITQAAR